jgi:ATP-dependent Lon protease
LLPGSVSTLPVGRKRSLALVAQLEPGSLFVTAFQRDASVRRPQLTDLHGVGTLVRVHRIGRGDDGTARLVVEAVERVQLEEQVESSPFIRVRVEPIDTEDEHGTESLILAESLREHATELSKRAGGALAQAAEGEYTPGMLADRIASALPLEREHELEVLMTFDVPERLRMVARLLNEALEVTEMRRKIDEEVRKRMSSEQRKMVLRERMRAIKNQLGEDDEGEADALRKRLESIEFPEEVAKVVARELERAERLNPAQPEAGVIRNYLETIADLPWDQRAEPACDLERVSAQLEADHHGLADVKERILEHMAVLKLSGSSKGTVLCFSGPPGVGKTSLGRSIADATDRPFIRISLGGVRDEAEIRGHRRTYVGALPGRIISALRKVKVKNPVILLDEIDKLGRGWAGDPEAALLELLDPEQNQTFTDHYLELPFDLSEVMFVCTVNDLGRLAAPLRDRLEIVELSGYTPDEKVTIARRHLLPAKLEEHALDGSAIQISDEALEKIVMEYTREAGVRQLGREIGKLCRSVALDVARNSGEDAEAPVARISVDDENLGERLGKRRFFNEVAERTQLPGVATGLAWTPVGGDILFIETSRMSGAGKLQITGQLGDVMKESASAALTYLRSNAADLGVDPAFLESSDLHIHVPAGAVPKDGPSAGVTIFTALTSLLTGRRVRPDTAMTGECTLRGRVLPVGGIKAKVLAAHRAGLRRIILPRRCGRDLDDVPAASWWRTWLKSWRPHSRRRLWTPHRRSWKTPPWGEVRACPTSTRGRVWEAGW